MPPTPPLTAVVPLKAIPSSKTRMAPTLSAADRALLLRRTFARVAQALRDAVHVDDVLVVVGDATGRAWADEQGLRAMAEPEGTRGLNAALSAVDAHLGSRPTIVVPADLPLVTGADVDRAVLAATTGIGVVVVPTADGGTGALVRRPGGIIAPCFGIGSAAAHVAEARRSGVGCRRLDIAGLALDLDRPADITRAGWSIAGGGRSLAT